VELAHGGIGLKLIVFGRFVKICWTAWTIESGVSVQSKFRTVATFNETLGPEGNAMTIAHDCALVASVVQVREVAAVGGCSLVCRQQKVTEVVGLEIYCDRREAAVRVGLGIVNLYVGVPCAEVVYVE